MSMEEYEIACLKREWEAERERERQDLLRIEDPTRLVPRTYAVTEGFEDQELGSPSKHYYDIAYRVSETTDKMIRFSLIEHYLQFVDLLHEAGYKYFDEQLRFTNDIK